MKRLSGTVDRLPITLPGKLISDTHLPLDSLLLVMTAAVIELKRSMSKEETAESGFDDPGEVSVLLLGVEVDDSNTSFTNDSASCAASFVLDTSADTLKVIIGLLVNVEIRLPNKECNNNT